VLDEYMYFMKCVKLWPHSGHLVDKHRLENKCNKHEICVWKWFLV